MGSPLTGTWATGTRSGGSAVPTVTGGAAHTKGAYVELFASTPNPSTALLVSMQDGSNSSQGLFDIAIGAASSEIIICPNLGFRLERHGDGGASYYIPFDLPAGTRISARVQSSLSSGNLKIGVNVLNAEGSERGMLKMETWGANEGNSGGTIVDPNPTINTKGSWVEITPGTLNHNYAMAFANLSQRDFIIPADVRGLFDIGFGASGSEVVVWGDIPTFAASAFDFHYLGPWGFMPITIPPGTRISARSQANSTADPESQLDLIVYGLGE